MRYDSGYEMREVRVRHLAGGIGFCVVCGIGALLAQAGRDAAPAPVAELLQNATVKAALAAAKASEPQTIEDQIRFCEIPAPEFKEEVRGAELKRMFQGLGLQNVRVDKVGNVLG